MSTSGDYKQQHLIKMANQIATASRPGTISPARSAPICVSSGPAEMLQTLREIAAETPDILSEDVHSACKPCSPGRAVRVTLLVIRVSDLRQRF